MPGSNLFNRATLIHKLEQTNAWDMIVIGGGATGLGVALDAALRGLSVVLFEQHDFAKGTSSRSTKLIHGGVRYLAQGNIALVYSALHERDLLTKNAPHVVHSQSFIIPCYSYGEVIKYSFGLRMYDLLAGSFGLGRSRFIGKKELVQRMPNVSATGLKGGVEYFDGQFDDARLAINIAQTAVESSAVVLNYFRVTGMIKTNGKVRGVKVTDEETGKPYSVNAGTVINATGVFVDDVLKMDNPNAVNTVRPSQGVHVVIDSKFMMSKSAMLIPKTEDGRVLFAVPWHRHVVVGTTDTLMNETSLEPKAMQEELKFIFDTVNRYLNHKLEEKDVLSVFAGLRPLAASSHNNQSTKELSRDHKLFTSESGMITITGGKWTTYRKMAEETVDLVMKNAGMKPGKSTTANKPLHGAGTVQSSYAAWGSVYGKDEILISQLMSAEPHLAAPLVNGFDHTLAEVVWAARHEMARSIEDVLARRLRILFLNAQAAIDAARKVADLLQAELNWDDEHKNQQLNDFYKIAYHYTLNR